MRDGREVWVTGGKTAAAQEAVFFVRDYGTLRPKLVYNCYLVASLCKNAVAYLGAGVTTATFHFDKNKQRNDERRNGDWGSGCDSKWIDRHTCPEGDQPNWWFEKDGAVSQGPLAPRLSERGGETSKNRLGWFRTEYDENMQPTDHWFDYGAIFSCDEFPAASWIEGGKSRGTINPKTANTYCAPMSNPCTGEDGDPGGYTEGLQTDQNWQAHGFNQLRTWFQKLAGNKWRTNKSFSIFKFDFEMVNNPSIGTAVWVEANGVKRYCYGLPTKESCSSDLLATDGDPDNSG
ncbi:hypothetical protein GQ53DRAFT_828591 [Thozetella sp. PMI_491]|nr:hypothetical protein GQ53DRAFT_828591 [Thozetella sp. PMI_491]